MNNKLTVIFGAVAAMAGLSVMLAVRANEPLAPSQAPAAPGPVVDQPRIANPAPDIRDTLRETDPANWTALDGYVNTADDAFAFEPAGTREFRGGTVHGFILTSQRWQDESRVEQPLWRHAVQVFVPAEQRARHAVLYIDGGSSRTQPLAQDLFSGAMEQISTQLGAVVVRLTNVPNQPFVFADGRARWEDDTIAESWKLALEANDESLILQLPMVKSAVAAMDMTDQLAGEGLFDPPAGYMVTGASKRGWTTWLTAAVDTRVSAIAPLVIDILHMEKVFPQQKAAYGFYAPPLRDYTSRGLIGLLGTPDAERLIAVVDPFRYRDRLTMPKYVVNAANDEFFLLDGSRFSYDDLPGPKGLWVVANAGHAVITRPDVVPSVVAFFDMVERNEPLPETEFSLQDGTVRFSASDDPARVLSYRAVNETARDFRTVSVGLGAFEPTPLDAEDGIYHAPVPAPESGFAATIIEAWFITGSGLPLRLSSHAYITPDELPFAEAAAQQNEEE